eukprot:CAMPEP_0194104764 /NCGR_PEP_ID=MMETSP0150-20130528/5059_1 /TAXON_ID=122233 /ORGANISM="Chaetoceros debilis, Strain MM31A-1" /LENGTH=660 /DNA_ID=CAMNT_0038792405 /DNA_START=67 /DNA_END=2049 /DNA_ORIENTATION=+
MKLYTALGSIAAISQVLVAAQDTPPPLVQYTPELSDWSAFYSKAVDNNPKNTDHSPDGIGWIDRDDWIPWDGTVIDPTEHTRQELSQKICPGSTVLGLREVFYENNPFADITNPTKAEVDLWHTIALNHVRALVGYTEEEYIIRPNRCLHLRALWCDEKFRTRKWDTTEYPERCESSNNPHCGAGFIPSVEDQQPYLPEDITSCPKRSGSEGLFSAAKSNIPWSMKWARPFCATLGGEGFWGGHTGPWFHRSEFGWGWWDGDADNFNVNAGLRTKWSGSSGEVKYEDPDITNGVNKVLVEGVNPDPRFTGKECETRIWLNGGADTATKCYSRMMDDDRCGKRFMTRNSLNDGCACYPTNMSFCSAEIQPGRLTWDFEPIQSSFDGLLVDTTKAFSNNQLPYNGRRCPNILWKGKSGDVSHCLQIIMLGEGDKDVSDCGRNFITYNSANGGCGCYPESQQTCTRSESIGESGRQTYELEVDPTWNPPADPSPPPSEVPSQERSQTPSTGPSYGPSHGPSRAPSDADDMNCIENNNSKFFARTRGDEKKYKCKQLRKKNDKKKQKMCEMTEIASDGTKPAKDVCPVTCDICNCGEIANAKFYFKTNPGGIQQKNKTCGWLEKYFERKPEKAQEICNMETPDFDIIKPLASEACRITCDTCLV